MNLTDPIIPGASAAGVRIGDAIQQILAGHPSSTVDRFAETEKYSFDGITLWVRNGRVKQIGVTSPYTGKVLEKVGIGSTIREVETMLGKITQDKHDSLIVSGHTGWCFETERWRSGQNVRQNPHAKLTEILVFEAPV